MLSCPLRTGAFNRGGQRPRPRLACHFHSGCVPGANTRGPFLPYLRSRLGAAHGAHGIPGRDVAVDPGGAKPPPGRTRARQPRGPPLWPFQWQDSGLGLNGPCGPPVTSGAHRIGGGDGKRVPDGAGLLPDRPMRCGPDHPVFAGHPESVRRCRYEARGCCTGPFHYRCPFQFHESAACRGSAGPAQERSGGHGWGGGFPSVQKGVSRGPLPDSELGTRFQGLVRSGARSKSLPPAVEIRVEPTAQGRGRCSAGRRRQRPIRSPLPKRLGCAHPEGHLGAVPVARSEGF